MANRLARESSPYLRQHADNPVDWLPWSGEALARAREEDRPILLSVGYSACHWCHVMERESFADPETARLMNERFVSVKVDREERPDVDSVYMSAVQQLTGHGGWPLTVFLLPSGEPFYGGTYFPPEPRHGMPSFREVLDAVSRAYRERRGEVDRSAAEMRDALHRASLLRGRPGAPTEELLSRAAHGILERFDAGRGGFGGAPKFPQPMTLEFLLAWGRRTGTGEAERAVEATLDRMAAGGLYDQAGGGFHRYSVDADWLVPHFEKMLYDNALLVRAYLHGFQATGRTAFRAVAEETLAFLLREMRRPDGGFAAALDADSEGGEGRFYVWEWDELRAALGSEELAAVRERLGASEGGNFEGRSILHHPSGRRPPPGDDPVAERALASLLGARADRVRPHRDDKVVAAWNGMTLAALAEAGRILARDDLLGEAIDTARFLLDTLRPGGELHRIHMAGAPTIPGQLDDHAHLADGLFELYAATGGEEWVAAAVSLLDAAIEGFWEEEEGIFYDAPGLDDGPVVRARDLFDNAVPSGTSIAVATLQRAARLLGEERYGRIAARALEAVGDLPARAPTGFGELLRAADATVAPPRELVVAGHPEREDTRALRAVAHGHFLPHLLHVVAPSPPRGRLASSPLLRDRGEIDGRAAGYLCRGYACERPVTDPADLERLLA